MPLHGSVVLITGGAGAFGQAFARRALDDGAKKVVIYSRGEAAQAAMRASFNDDRLRFILGDIRDQTRITEACRGVDIVIHAAALKRVEQCEEHPSEAIATNVAGTQHVARACIANGAQKAIFLSTDKAASPTTLYGATKLVAERTWIQSNIYAAGTVTRFSATRYGNVLGSTGSVVPIWREQAKAGLISITDLRMTRFFMEMDDAVHLVLLALREMRGGEVFVPKIGSAPIHALASAIMPELKVDEIGIRAGEKLHEVLISKDEARHTYDAGGHYIIEPSQRTWGAVPALTFPKVDEDFLYTSNNNPGWKLSVAELREMIG